MVDVTGIEVQLRAARQAASDADRLERSLDKLGRQGTKTEGAFDRVRKTSTQMGGTFDKLKDSIFSVQGALRGLALAGIAQQIGAAALAAERITNALKFATGSAEGAADALRFVREESDRLGLAATSTAEAFSGIAAAAQGTALQGDAVREIFLGVAEASSALNLSADNTQGALLALSQMISKGTVQAEELRGQLGERIPGAFQIAARAMGVTTEELGKMLEKGEVIADDFLPRFAAEMRRSFGESATQAATGLNAAINRLTNAYDEFLRTLGESGVIDAATQIITNLGNIIFNVSTLFTRAKTAVIEFFDQFSDAPQTLTGTAAKLDLLSKKIIKLSEQRAVSPFPEQLDEHIAELRAEYDKLQKQYLKTSDAQGELTLEITNGFQPVNVLSSGIDKLGNAAGKAGKQLKSFADQFADLRGDLDPLIPAAEKYNTSVEMLNRAMKEGKITMEEGNRLLGVAKDRFLESADASDTLTESLNKSTDAGVTLTKTADPFFEAWNRSIEDVSRAISDGLVGGFKDAASTIKNIFSSLLSSLVNAALRNRIIIPMGLAPGTAAAGGFGGGGFNPGSLFGLSGGATTKGASPISPMAAGGLPGGGASSLPFSGNLGFLNNSSFVSNPLTSGIGGLAGNFGANALLGGNRGAGAGIGGTLGAIGGSFLPLPPGINTAIGSFIGNAIGGLFGGDKKSRVALASNTSPAGFEDQVSAQSAFGTIGFSRGRTQGISDASKFKPLFDSIAQLDNVLASSLIPEQINKIKDSLEGFISNKLTSSDAFRPEQLEQLIRERLNVIFGAMDENIARLGDAFRGLPIEQMVQGFASLSKVSQFLKADPFKDFSTAMVEGSRTLYQQALVSRRELIDLARSFDGSLDAAQELAAATQNRYQIELALLQQIDSVSRGISSSFSDTREQIIQATLSQEQLYDRLSTRAEDLARQMQTAIDPQVIGELAAQINQLTGRAFGLLGEEQKQSSQAGFLDFLSGVENLAGQRLDMSRQSIAVDRDAGLSGTVASELSKVIGGFGAQQQRLLSEQERAAVAQREAAEASRRAAEAQEKAALARETYYSGMGGR